MRPQVNLTILIHNHYDYCLVKCHIIRFVIVTIVGKCSKTSKKSVEALQAVLIHIENTETITFASQPVTHYPVHYRVGWD